jgi:hypothetical protein
MWCYCDTYLTLQGKICAWIFGSVFVMLLVLRHSCQLKMETLIGVSKTETNYDPELFKEIMCLSVFMRVRKLAKSRY